MVKLLQQQQRRKAYYTIKLNASGYEYRTNQLWTFDSLMNLSYCHQDWSSEGTEGKSDHFFEQEKLYAVQDENGNDQSKDVSMYHKELGGIGFTEPMPTDTTANPLSRKYFLNSEAEIKQEFSQIIKLLKDNFESISKADPAVLVVETESENEEMPGKEKTEITIDRKLLEALIN